MFYISSRYCSIEESLGGSSIPLGLTDSLCCTGFIKQEVWFVKRPSKYNVG